MNSFHIEILIFYIYKINNINYLDLNINILIFSSLHVLLRLTSSLFLFLNKFAKIYYVLKIKDLCIFFYD